MNTVVSQPRAPHFAATSTQRAPWRAVVVGMLITLLAGPLTIGVPPTAHAAPKPPPPTVRGCVDPGPLTNLDSAVGFRWKPGLARRDTLVTMTPYNGRTVGYPNESFVAADAAAVEKVAACANVVTIDFTPARKLIKDGGGCDDTDATSFCPTTDEQCAATPDPFECWKTLQHQAIVDFIVRSRGSGLKFLLHARVNYDDGTTTKPPNLDAYAEEFVSDTTAILKLAYSAGAGDLIAGVMIGEHDHTDGMAEGLRLAVLIADKINAATTLPEWPHGFLREPGKKLTLHGEGFGMKFEGIRQAVDEVNFFPKISARVSEFSFAFKFFESKYALGYRALGPEGSITIANQDKMDAGDWREYLTTWRSGRRDVALSELARVVTAAQRNFPRHSGVIFVGDSADGTFNLRNTIDPDAVVAARQVFARYGWHGFVFGLPFDRQDQTTSKDFCRGNWMWRDNGSLAQQSPQQTWLRWRKAMRPGEKAPPMRGVHDICGS